MTDTNIQPYWELSTGDRMSELRDVQILHWAKGICIAGHDIDGNLIHANAYELDEVYDLKTIEELLLNEPLLADPQPVSKIWNLVRRSMLVPENWSNRANIDSWFQEIYFVEHDESMSTAHAHDFGIDVYFPKKHMFKEMTKQYFPNRVTKFLIPPKNILRYYKYDNALKGCVIFLEHTCSITIFQNNQLLKNSVIEIQNTEDVVAALAINANLEGEKLADMELIVTGVASNLNEWVNELRQYFNKVNVSENLDIESFLKELSLCE